MSTIYLVYHPLDVAYEEHATEEAARVDLAHAVEIARDDLRREGGWHDSADQTALYRCEAVARLDTDRNEVVEVPRQPRDVLVPESCAGWRKWATAAARALDNAAKDPACSEPEWLRGAATTIRGALRSPSLGPRIQRPVSVTLVGLPLPGPPCERCQGTDPDCRTCGGMGCPIYVDGVEG